MHFLDFSSTFCDFYISEWIFEIADKAGASIKFQIGSVPAEMVNEGRIQSWKFLVFIPKSFKLSSTRTRTSKCSIINLRQYRKRNSNWYFSEESNGETVFRKDEIIENRMVHNWSQFRWQVVGCMRKWFERVVKPKIRCRCMMLCSQL
jgi:hypothetical protein